MNVNRLKLSIDFVEILKQLSKLILHLLKKIRRQYYKSIDPGEMLFNHRMRGKFKVQYPDGRFSQPFGYRTASDYAEMFGGTVIDNF